MPGVSRTDRLHALYEELRRRGPDGATGPELAERFGVSIRTITRDLATLQRTGAPIVAQRGPGGGYALDTSATLPPVLPRSSDISYTARCGTIPAAAAGAARPDRHRTNPTRPWPANRLMETPLADCRENS